MNKHTKTNPKSLLKKVREFIRGHIVASVISGVCFLLCIALTVPLIYVAKNGFKIEKPYTEVIADTGASSSEQAETDEIIIPDVEIADEGSSEDAKNNEDINDLRADEQSEETTDLTIYDSVNNMITSHWETLSYGIDVSSHNGKIDWKKVAAAGVEFVMIRCGYRGYVTGKIVQDARFEENIRGAAENGISIGVYFYSTAITEAEARQEAAWVCRLLDDKAEEGIKLLFPVAYDFEEFFNKNKSRADNLSRQQLTKNTIAFLNYVSASGYNPMLYASKSSITHYWDFNAIKNYDFWLAHYVEATNYKGEYAMWQYTCKGKVNGIKGYTDLNMSFYRYVYPSEPVECVNSSATVYNGYSGKAGEGGMIVSGVLYERIRTLITGWSEIRYNGLIGYVKTNELKKAEFTECDEVLTLDRNKHIYSIAVTNDTYKVGTLSAGTEIRATATYKNKWHEFIYNGEKAYIKW